jgi:acylphosphatase
MTVCRRFTISGRVQGVGFRYAAYAEARRLGIAGWVCNLANGDVEALACGEPDEMRAFEQWLWHGPRAARVTAVRATDAAPQEFHEFAVR